MLKFEREVAYGLPGHRQLRGGLSVARSISISGRPGMRDFAAGGVGASR